MSKANLGHELSGLIRFAERAPWDERLDDLLAFHLDPVCEATGLDPDAIFDAVGHHWEGTLWGCAFEDLMAREPEADGPNLVDDHIKRRGWNEKAPNKAYMRAVRQAATPRSGSRRTIGSAPQPRMLRRSHLLNPYKYRLGFCALR